MPTLRTLREQALLSRKALARAADVSESTIVRMEEGKQHATREATEKVLHALGQALGRAIAAEDIEGLKLYNVMRDRRQRTKTS